MELFSKLQLPLHVNSLQLTNRYLHDFMYIGHANVDFIAWLTKWYFCECTGKPGTFGNEQNPLHCTDRETFNVKIMLNMPKINRVRAKSIISLGRSHRDVARVVIVFIPQFTDNRKYFQTKNKQKQNGKCTIAT